MNNHSPDVRFVFSFACIIFAIAYGFAGSLLFLGLSGCFVVLSYRSFVCFPFRIRMQGWILKLQYYTFAGITWILLGSLYFTVFSFVRCVLSFRRKKLLSKPNNAETSWVNIVDQGKTGFERQF